jgi:thymidylate synthase ThyX
MPATARTLAPGAEARLGREVPVLDLGFVQPIDYMGIDEDIVQAARVSYGPEHPQARRATTAASCAT